jgi:hypothetical protein
VRARAPRLVPAGGGGGVRESCLREVLRVEVSEDRRELDLHPPARARALRFAAGADERISDSFGRCRQTKGDQIRLMTNSHKSQSEKPATGGGREKASL